MGFGGDDDRFTHQRSPPSQPSHRLLELGFQLISGASLAVPVPSQLRVGRHRDGQGTPCIRPRNPCRIGVGTAGTARTA